MAHYLGHIYYKNIAAHLKFKCSWVSFTYLASPLFQRESLVFSTLSKGAFISVAGSICTKTPTGPQHLKLSFYTS